MPRHTQYGLLSAFAAVIAIFVLTTNLAMQEADKHANAVHEILNELTSHPIALLRSLVNVSSSVSSMQNSMESIMLLPDEKTIAQNLADIELEEKKALDEYGIIETLLAGAQGKYLAVEAQKEFLDWRPLRMEVVNSIREGKNKEAVLAVMERNSRHIAKLISSHLEIKKYARDKAFDTARKAIISGDAEIFVDKIALLIAVLLSGFIAISITRLKQREMEAAGRLLQSRQDAQTYLDVAGVMLIALNRAGEITMINRRGCEILNVAQEEALGRNWFESYLPKEVVDEVKQVFCMLMDGNVPPSEYHENRILTSDGRERILAFHNALLRDAAGKVVAVLSSGEDITERTQAESALADFRDWLEHTQKIAHLGSWMQSFETGELKWSDETYRIFGLEPQSVKMSVELFLRMIHPDDRARVVEETRKAQESEGHLYKAEYRIILPDGMERVVYEEATLYPRGESAQTHLYGYILDITERKRAEEELSRFFNLVPDMVCIASADGHFLKINPMWETTLGYTEQEILSTPIVELIHPDDREA
ncbi:MAG: PAS domain S-box protein, partial [Nitrospinae bacterium]|nr:PAS domain S-box protein [Nitrospinota bacterium]